MAKITRVAQRIFASTAPAGASVGGVIKFGSVAAGDPVPSTDVSVIQSLSAWLNGWLYAIVGENGPVMEDMNAVMFVITTQLAYLFQAGIAEWDTDTSYYTGSLVNVSGVVYVSLTDGNSAHAVTNTTYWAVWGQNTAAASTSTSMSAAIDYYRVDASGGAVTMTLPALASNLNKKFRVKKIDSSANAVTVKGNGSELVDFANTFLLESPGASIDLVATASCWDIV